MKAKSKEKKEKKENSSKKDGSQKSKSKGKQSVSPKKDKDEGKSKDEGKQKIKSKKKEGSPSQVSEVSIIAPPPPAQMLIKQRDCVHHKSPFINFCETCEELVCSQCTVYGPHNNHLHRILKMTDAFRLRKYCLVEAIRSNLVDKRDKIVAQLHRLEYRIEEIKFVKNIIERDVRSEYSAIQERLKHFQGVKIAHLSHQLSLTQKNIDTINDIGNSFFQFTDMNCDKIEQERKRSKFLNQSKNMYEAVEHILQRAEKMLPDICIQDMPREVEAKKEQIKRAMAGKQINFAKNEIIWKLMMEIKHEQMILKKEVDARASQIIFDKSQQVQQLNFKLNELKMVCFYCGLRLNPDLLNTSCEENCSKQFKQSIQKLDKTPQSKYFGSKRHYFAKIISI